MAEESDTRAAAYSREYRSRPIDPDRCGTSVNYSRGCRCTPCTTAVYGDNRHPDGHPTANMIYRELRDAARAAGWRRVADEAGVTHGIARGFVAGTRPSFDAVCAVAGKNHPLVELAGVGNG